MNQLSGKFSKFGCRYRNNRKLKVHRHYIVYFINASKHIEDISPEIRSSMVMENFKHDVVFLVGDLRFPAHKSILQVTNEMFYNQHVEPFGSSSEITLNDISPSGFQQFLGFCQFGEVNLNPLNMMPTFDVANTYQHSALAAICANFICENVQESNVLEILDWNLSHQHYQIMRCCRGFFIAHAMEILRDNENFHAISKQLLKTILGWEILNCSEKLLFNETVKWAAAECARRKIVSTLHNKHMILEDVIHLIRLDISPDLEVHSDFPVNPRANRFHKKRFDNLSIHRDVAQTIENFPPTNNDVTCHGFSMILSNPESKLNTNEHFLMTLDTVDDLVFQKEFRINNVTYLAFTDFVFEKPIVMGKHKRHFLKVKFMETNRARYMESDKLCARIVRLYDC